MNVEYINSLDQINPGSPEPTDIRGFFVGWKNPPGPGTLVKILKRSGSYVLAIDRDNENRIIGFINCLTDGILSAYIPLLEVLPEYQANGIGKELVRQLLKQLGPIYMIDLVCDREIQPFYEKAGFNSCSAMIKRDYDCQSGSTD
ncbi:MAG: GNAT family N-acetyltransferase [bacterium]|nr:GNAT family N-acetyltransferase [bacterium]